MNLADAMDHAGIEENSLRQRGLPSIDVGRNPNVASPLKRKRTIRMIWTSTHSSQRKDRL